MGIRAAHSILQRANRQSLEEDFSFEMFAHATEFFGLKAIFLGCFREKQLDTTVDDDATTSEGRSKQWTCQVRQDFDKPEFIKVFLDNLGRMRGAILLGETDLEVGGGFLVDWCSVVLTACRKRWKT